MPKVYGSSQLDQGKLNKDQPDKTTAAYRSHLEDIITHFKQEEDNELDKEFISYIKEDLILHFDVSEEEADKMINKSVFMKLLKEDPDYVYHYEAEYWANYIFSTQMIEYQV